MADVPKQNGNVDLPPKLDLRKQGILRKAPVLPGAAAAGPAQTGQTDTTVRLNMTGAPAAGGTTSTPQPAIRIQTQAPVGASSSGAIRIGQPAAPASSGAVRPLPVTPPPAQDSAATAAKHQTSRIPLDAAAVVPPAEAVTPKTIRIKPMVSPRATANIASFNKLGQEPAVPAAGAPEANRETSRISLEAALATENKVAETAPSDGSSMAPKTIRLRSPNEAATVRVPQKPQAPAEAKPAMGKTARLDDLPEEEDGQTLTRRKTIRVKRPTTRTTVAGEEDAAAGATGAAQISRAPVTLQHDDDDACNPVFPIFTAVSMVVLLVVVYMFAAQTFGPLICGTDTTYLKSPNLAWPGKLTR